MNESLNLVAEDDFDFVIKGIQFVVAFKDYYNVRVMNLSLSAYASAPYFADPLDLSAAWIDLTLSAGFQEVFAQALYSPANTKVQLPPALAAKLVVGEARVAALKYPDWDAINPQRDDLLTKWTQTFGS